MPYSRMMRCPDVQAVLLVIAFVSAASWWLLLNGLSLQSMPICSASGFGPEGGPWNLEHGVALAVMWAWMTVAMMLPNGAVAILEASWRRRGRSPIVMTAVCFSLGYLAVALTLGVGAAAAEWALESARVLGNQGEARDTTVRGLLLAAAGLGCMAKPHHGAAPAAREVGRAPGRRALLDGLRFGRAGLGRCAATVCFQFAVGPMSIPWMAAVTAWMFVEASNPWRRRSAQLAGVALLCAGVTTFGAVRA